MRPNAPPIVSSLLQHAAPAIIALNGEAFLPPEAYYPAGPDVLGGRGFGFVLPTRMPGVVMKITLDGSEVFALEVMRKLGPRHGGLPEQKGESMRIDWEGEPVWIYWRQDAPPPSLEEFLQVLRRTIDHRMPHRELFEFRDDKRDKWLADRSKLEGELGVSDGKRLAAAHDCAMGVASRVAYEVVHRGADLDVVLVELAHTLASAQAIFAPKERKSYVGGWTTAPGADDMPFPLNAALDVLGYEFHLRAVEQGVLAPDLATSLLRLLKAGVMLCDADAQNISAANRTRPVLFDLGFCLPLQCKWLPLWEEVGPVLARWWNHDARYRPWMQWHKRTYG